MIDKFTTEEGKTPRTEGDTTALHSNRRRYRTPRTGGRRETLLHCIQTELRITTILDCTINH